MFVVVVHHWCKPDRIEAALQRVDANGDEMAQAPGFLYRYRMDKPDEPLRLSTITAWTDEASFRACRSRRPPLDLKDPSLPYDRVVTESFFVRRAHNDPRA